MAGTSKRLAKARRTRSRIAQQFAALENGQTNAVGVIRTPPPCLGRIRIYDVLRRLPKLDRDGAENVLQRAKVWPLTTMDNLTKEEKARILLALPPRVKDL